LNFLFINILVLIYKDIYPYIPPYLIY